MAGGQKCLITEEVEEERKKEKTCDAKAVPL